MKRVLMITHSAGYTHDYLETASTTISGLSKKSEKFKTTCTKECDLLNKKDLEKFDAIIFATTGELPISDRHKEELMESILDGKAFIGIHNATDTFHKFSEYGKMIGGYFNGHPWSQKANFRVEDPGHPSTQHLPKSFSAVEEIYVFREWSRKKTHVLISLDNDSVDLKKGNREDNDYAICWCHNYGKARVFYTGFGHYIDLWAKDWFQEHILKGILWALKLM